jgi:hypothetical protein
MNPALDQLLVAALILGAVTFFAFRLRRLGKSCGSDCGTPGKPSHRPWENAPRTRPGRH